MPDDVRSGAGWHYDTRGWVVIDKDGAKFSGYDVSVDVSVEADNVIIRGNRITSGNGWPIALRHTIGVVIDQNTIGGTSQSRLCDNAIRGIYGDDDQVTITSNNIRWCSSGINHLNAGGLIAGNYIHDLGYTCDGRDSSCGHFNGIQLGAGSGPRMVIDNNTVLLSYGYTDAIMLANDDGPQRNRTITNNLLGGGGYTFYGSGSAGGIATGIIFTGNQFTTRYFPRSGAYGPVAHWQLGVGNVWSNNTWADGPNAGKLVGP